MPFGRRTPAAPSRPEGSFRWPSRNGKPRPRAAACAARHDALTAPTVVEDKDTGEFRRPHHIDLKTGMYRGRQVIVQREPTDEE